MSAMSDQDFRQRAAFAVVRDRAQYGDPRLCMARLFAAASELLTATSHGDGVACAIEIAALAQRIAVDGHVPLKFPRPACPLGGAGEKRGGGAMSVNPKRLAPSPRTINLVDAIPCEEAEQ
jgi:hypothetical protein